jgi:hypothetical protein
MTIDIASLETGDPVHIGADPDAPLLAGDSIKASFTIAEAFDANDNPVNPADFTADGGWVGAIEIEGDPFTANVTGFGTDGSYVIDWDDGVTATKVGSHRYNIFVTNAALSDKRTIQKGTIVIESRFAA